MPYSIAMLLRSPFAMSKDVLEAAGSKAYGVLYNGSDEKYFVLPGKPLVAGTRMTWMKSGPSMITILESAGPYLGEPAEVAQGFRDERLACAWIEHRAWAAFDLQNRDVPKRQAYGVLAALVAELIDARCAGIYLPKENQFTIQGDGSAERHLRSLQMAAGRR